MNGIKFKEKIDGKELIYSRIVRKKENNFVNPVKKRSGVE